MGPAHEATADDAAGSANAGGQCVIQRQLSNSAYGLVAIVTLAPGIDP
jgi:hypothetical protein